MKNISKGNLITFIYKGGRKNRLIKNSTFPSEFFYGYIELLSEGYNVNIFEESDLGFRVDNKFLEKGLAFFSRMFFNIPLNMLCGFIFNRGYKKLSGKQTIIATTNGVGLCLVIAKKLGLLQNKIVFINMGLFHEKPNFFKFYIYKRILKNVKMLCLSKFEKEFISYYLKNKNVSYLQFGVDESFWNKNNFYENNYSKNNSYIVSIGGDLARDWDLLINSWQIDFPLLKIISPRKLKTSKNNIQIISSNWHNQKLSDLEIKDIILNALFIIIPLKETIQPSGQSSCLQAMACSKAVLISDIKGIWDRDLLKHKENIFFIKPSDNKALIKGVKSLIKENSLRVKLENNGRKLIEDKLNSYKMVDNLKEYLME